MKPNHVTMFNSPLHRQWKRDRAMRLRVPLEESWRGCVGLAALLKNVEDTFYHGDKCFIDNCNVTWMALRDIPAGHFPGSASMNARGVNYVNKGVATLRHGMPVIDFTADARDAIDFKFMPFDKYLKRIGRNSWDLELVEASGDVLHSGRYEREFAVLNQLSASMTHFAFHGVDGQGKPIRQAWASRRRGEGRLLRPSRLETCFPVPYLAFPKEAADRLYWLATESQSEGHVFRCATCGHPSNSKLFRNGSCNIDFFETGDFVADCPSCMKPRKWHLDDAKSSRIRRRFPLPFRQQFCAAVSKGLPLHAIESSTYRGTARSSQHGSQSLRMFAGRCDLIPHAFESRIDGHIRIIYQRRTQAHR